MNICGCLVHARKDKSASVAQQIDEMHGAEIHGQADDGRFVVVVEDTDDRLASEIIMEMHQLSGVVSLTLNYHHFEDLSTPSNPDFERPPQAGEPSHDLI